MKIHKAGSTSLQNIFYRYGFHNNLTIAAFSQKFPYPETNFSQLLLPLSDPGSRYDIFCEHCIYNKYELDKTMTQGYHSVAILREPLSQLRSSMRFYGFSKKLGIENHTDPVSTFLLNLDRYELRIMWNRVAYEFGFGDGLHYERGSEFGFEKFDKYISFLDSHFQFVAVMEKWDESLVLMRRKFCWSLKDILYLPMRSEKHQDYKEKDEDLKRILRQKSQLDYALYDFFLDRLDREIKHQPPEFFEEVKHFKLVLDKMKLFCADLCAKLGREVNHNANKTSLKIILQRELKIEAGPRHEDIMISGSECVMMMLEPRVYRNAIKAKQYTDLCQTTKSGKHGGADKGRMEKGNTNSNNNNSKSRIKHLNSHRGHGMFNPSYCKDHFVYKFPWKILFQPEKNFLIQCYKLNQSVS